MKLFKNVICVLLCIILVSSCSFPAKKPEEGIWYCEELRLSIDFSKIYSPDNCAVVYNENGEPKQYVCHIDYGNGIFITDNDNEYYLRGSFKYNQKKQTFTVTSFGEDIKYVFVRYDSTEKIFEVLKETGDGMNPLKR